jgi:CRP-like cAMP-binding protein
LSALFFGLLSAATLPLGAAVGILWRPADRILAILTAFGGGALLAALTIDLIAPGVDEGHFPHLALGAAAGGVLFKILDWLVNRQGGYLRKPSTALTYWRNQARRRFKQLLVGIRRAKALGDLSSEALDSLLSIALIHEYRAHTCLYRAEDPASHLYVILKGRVELSDPARGGAVFERLGLRDAFGRMSFITGLHRATEAHAITDVKLLTIPRDAFMALLATSTELRQAMCKRLQDDETARYLVERHGMKPDEVAAWQENAVAELDATGTYSAPIPRKGITDAPSELLRTEKRTGFFEGLSSATLERVTSRLVHKTRAAGWNYFHQGQAADRLFLLRRGIVYLLEPDDRARRPIVIEPGQVFGGLAFLTGGSHAVTAVGQNATDVSELRRKDFDELVAESPELRDHLAAYLRRGRVTTYLTERQHLDARRAAAWVERATKHVTVGRSFPSLIEMTQQVAAHKGAAVAIFLGMALDGIPESFVIGANVLVTGGISLSLLGGLILANFPEALSSSAGMKEQGMSRLRILAMWTGLMVMTGVGAMLGAIALANASQGLFATIEGLAAGAMLAMVAETMLPEAFHRGGGVVGLSTLAGFLVAIYFNTL